MTRIGELIRKQRISRGLTQAYISDRLGYSSIQFLSNIERGISSLPDEKINQLGSILQMNPKKLCDAKVKDYRERVYSLLDDNAWV